MIDPLTAPGGAGSATGTTGGTRPTPTTPAKQGLARAAVARFSRKAVLG
jgi:hypothetical protein